MSLCRIKEVEITRHSLKKDGSVIGREVHAKSSGHKLAASNIIRIISKIHCLL